MSSCSILLTVHALTQWNVDRRTQGHIDTPLNAVGRRMAALLASRLAGVPLTRLYSSDLRRALETLRPLADLKKQKIFTDPRLRERRVQGLKSSGEFPTLPFLRETEEWGDVETRMMEVMEEIAVENPNGCVLVVSHGGAVKVFLERVLGETNGSLSYAGKRCALNWLTRENGVWHVDSLNDDTHFQGIEEEGIHANNG